MEVIEELMEVTVEVTEKVMGVRVDSTEAQVAGFMHLWGLTVDVISCNTLVTSVVASVVISVVTSVVASVVISVVISVGPAPHQVISVGLCVDWSAHIAHGFLAATGSRYTGPQWALYAQGEAGDGGSGHGGPCMPREERVVVVVGTVAPVCPGRSGWWPPWPASAPQCYTAASPPSSPSSSLPPASLISF